MLFLGELTNETRSAHLSFSQSFLDATQIPTNLREREITEFEASTDLNDRIHNSLAGAFVVRGGYLYDNNFLRFLYTIYIKKRRELFVQITENIKDKYFCELSEFPTQK